MCPRRLNLLRIVKERPKPRATPEAIKNPPGLHQPGGLAIRRVPVITDTFRCYAGEASVHVVSVLVTELGDMLSISDA